MCTAACRHTLSTGHSRSRWPGIVELNLGESEHVVGRSTALLATHGEWVVSEASAIGCVVTTFLCG